MIYLRNNLVKKSYPMKKVGEIEYREILPKNGQLTLSRVVRNLDVKQVVLVGAPFTESYDVDARIKVAVDGFHVFTMEAINDRVWKLDSSILFHAYDDEKPLGAFATNQMKITVDWVPRRDVGVEVPCGIRLGVYEMVEELK